MASYLLGCRILEIAENHVYSDTHEKYFTELDELEEHILDNDDYGEIPIDVTTFPVYRVQYWFPDVEWVDWFMKKGNGIPSNENILDVILDMTYGNFPPDEYNNEDFTTKDLKNLDKLNESLIEYSQSGDKEKLEIALDDFEKSNEHIHFLYPKSNEPTIHQFRFVENEKDDVTIEFLGIKSV